MRKLLLALCFMVSLVSIGHSVTWYNLEQIGNYEYDPVTQSMKVSFSSSTTLSVTLSSSAALSVTGSTISVANFYQLINSQFGLARSTDIAVINQLLSTLINKSTVTVVNIDKCNTSAVVISSGSNLVVTDITKSGLSISTWTKVFITGTNTSTVTCTSKVIRWTFLYRSTDSTHYASYDTDLAGPTGDLIDGLADNESIDFPQPVTFYFKDLLAGSTVTGRIVEVK